MKIKHYVAGFLFSNDGTRVALIHKRKGPASVVGRWNAIGGKVEESDEYATPAMRREFLEEAGVDIPDWQHFLRLNGDGWIVDFFHAFGSDLLSQVRTMEEETVLIHHIESLPDVVPNLRWIIPMALGHDDDHVHVYGVTESEPHDA